ncbi:MAG: acyltransferase [Bacteroidaceae bacterium]|nr:acyltransferase [Bacteroidaceae bacterium]
MKERIEYIDLAKGICIFLVVLDHISNEGYFSAGKYPLNEVFEQMRMPLYFILSGLFFKDYQGGIREFLLRKFNRILVPYLFFYIIYKAIAWLVQNYTNFASTGANITSIWGPLWFLRCLFIMNVIFAISYYAIRRIKMSAVASEVLLGTTMFVIGILGYHLGDLRLNFGTAMTCMPFLWSGFVLNRRLHLLQRRIPWWMALIMALILFGMVYYLYVGENFFFTNTYNSSWPLLYIAGFSGTLAVLLLSSVIKWFPVISYIGRYSLIVLCTHMAIVTLLVASLHFLPETARQTGIWHSLIFLAITLAFSVFCCWLLKKYLPWFTAQKDLIKVDLQ